MIRFSRAYIIMRIYAIYDIDCQFIHLYVILQNESPEFKYLPVPSKPQDRRNTLFNEENVDSALVYVENNRWYEKGFLTGRDWNLFV